MFEHLMAKKAPFKAENVHFFRLKWSENAQNEPETHKITEMHDTCDLIGPKQKGMQYKSPFHITFL